MSEPSKEGSHKSTGSKASTSSSLTAATGNNQGVLCTVCGKSCSEEPTCRQMDILISKGFWTGMEIHENIDGVEDLRYPFCPCCRDKVVVLSQTCSQFQTTYALFELSVQNLAQVTKQGSGEGVGGSDDGAGFTGTDCREILRDMVLKRLAAQDSQTKDNTTAE